MRKMRKMIIMVCIAAMIINVPSWDTDADVSGTAPSETGNTLIVNVTVWKDEIITLNGNLTVNETGKLVLDNVVLLMNCTMNGSYHIEVLSGGEMHILNNSNITSANDYHYLFWVRSNSKFEMRDSELHGCGYNSDNAGLTLEAGNIIIENSTFSNNYKGITLSNSSNSNITNCTFYNNSYGIYLGYSSNNNTITNCAVYNNDDDGIYLWWDSSDNQITNCAVYNNSDGIYLSSSSNNNITNCAVYNNSYGILLGSSSDNKILNCAVYNNFRGIGIYSSDNNNITECMFYENHYYGIIFYSSNNNQITDSLCYKNGHGSIYFNHSSNNTVSNSTCSKSVTAIHLSYNSSSNTIKDCNISGNANGIKIVSSSNSNFIYNNILDNVNNAYDECTNYWNSSSEGNYWSDYNGTDEYSIPGGNNKDSYPSGIFKKETKIEEGMPIMYPVIICIAIILVCIMLYGVIETKTIIIRCPACGKTIRVKKKVRPFNLECKHCGRKGVLR